MLGWMKSEKLWGNVMGQGCGLRVVNQGRAVCSDHSCDLGYPCLGDVDVSVHQAWGGEVPITGGPLGLLQGMLRESFSLMPSPEQVLWATVSSLGSEPRNTAAPSSIGKK